VLLGQLSNLSMSIVPLIRICFQKAREAFKHLHVGMISPIKRKTLPEIAKVVGLDQEQSLHHFLTKSPWSVREQNTKVRFDFVCFKREENFPIMMKQEIRKRKRTDYVNRQYLGSWER